MTIATKLVVFPWFGLTAALRTNLAIGLIFTGVSLARSYLVRQAFEALRQPDPACNSLRSAQ
jgi:hypothetical protein